MIGGCRAVPAADSPDSAPRSGVHATLAGQSVDLSRADKSNALANVLTGLAQRFGAQAPANDDDPFARNRLGGGPASPASVLSSSHAGADAD
ncbi:MAG: hypothetical protein OXC99_11780 [Chloroflexi bacterium]|nr:hypothetical protein [Chloroflexota bacterium]